MGTGLVPARCLGMHVLIQKLKALHDISDEEETALLGALEGPYEVERGEDIAADGSMPKHSTVMLAGVACRYKLLADGRRQILAFQYPGDITDIYSYVLKRIDHGIGAVTKCSTAHLPHKALAALTEKYPNLAYTLWRDSLVDTAVAQTWLVNAGRRSAMERLAHMICEQFVRLSVVGLAKHGEPSKFYITQTDLADASGLSLVHVNKTLQLLKEKGLIGRNPNLLEILNWEGLRAVGGFDPTYLHLKGTHA
jgi:CRP-like cAMP-binding protein